MKELPERRFRCILKEGPGEGLPPAGKNGTNGEEREA